MAGIWHKAMEYLGLSDGAGYQDYEPYEEQPQPAAVRRPTPESDPNPPPRAATQASPDSGIAGITVQPRSSAVRTVTPIPAAPAKVQVIKPESFADAKEVGERFRNNQPVVVDLTTVDRALLRRMVDFASGLAFALSGKMDKVSDRVYLLTPSNVEVSAEERRRLQDAGSKTTA